MMNIPTRNQPIYVFRLTPETSLIWTALGSLLLLLAAAGASWYYATIHEQTVIFSLETSESGVWSVIQAFGSLLAITFATIFVHELIHGIAFAAFGGSPRYGFKIKHSLPLAYATSPGNLFHRHVFIVIALAPLVVIDVACLLLLAIFPQAPWLIWIIALNTGGAIGDIWIAVQLLRCPQSILVEDKEEGVAIYAPPSLTRQKLPFKITQSNRTRLGRRYWLKTGLIALALLLISSLLLIPLFKALEIPSFIIGNSYFWVFRWVNNTKGFGLEFNWLFFVLLIVILLFFNFFQSIIQQRRYTF